MTTPSPTLAPGRRTVALACTAPTVVLVVATLVTPVRRGTALDDALPSGAVLVALTCALAVVVLVLSDSAVTRGAVVASGGTGAVLLGASVLHLDAIDDELNAIPVAGFGGVIVGVFLLVVARGLVADDTPA